MEKHAFKCCKKFLFTICKWVSAFADRNGNKFKLVVLITYTLRILFQIFHSFWLEEGLYLKLIQSDKSWTGAEVMKCNEIRDFFYASTEIREFFFMHLLNRSSNVLYVLLKRFCSVCYSIQMKYFCAFTRSTSRLWLKRVKSYFSIVFKMNFF